MTFRVGQKVVAVKSAVARDPSCTVLTIPIGTICTIREIDTRCILRHGMATVRIVEYVNETMQTCMGSWEAGYRPDGFRPLTDISFAHEILRRATKPARTPAMSQQELS